MATLESHELQHLRSELGYAGYARLGGALVLYELRSRVARARSFCSRGSRKLEAGSCELLQMLVCSVSVLVACMPTGTGTCTYWYLQGTYLPRYQPSW